MASLPTWPHLSGTSASTGTGTGSPKRETADWIFEDPRSKALLAEVEQVAPSDASVLITGETGTGKELIARHLHSRSVRKNGPFVVVSCGAFSESLVDAELFGHEDRAFAGAFGVQAGWFEKADGGTIFLDEVNDLPLSVQNKLLRVLQDREVVRLGGRTPIPIDLRVLAATTVDLEELVQAKQFRKDLYYRLNVVRLDVLTLRERPGDIVPLARHFIAIYRRRLGYPSVLLTPEAERMLVEAPWHGNVRELENVIHRTLLLCDRSEIDVTNLRLNRSPRMALAAGAVRAPEEEASSISPAARGEPATPLHQAIRQLCEANVPDMHQLVEDALFREVFHYCHYSQSETARLLGVSRNVVRARLHRLGEVGLKRSRLVDGDGGDGEMD